MMRQVALKPRLSDAELRKLDKEKPWIDSNSNPHHYRLMTDEWEYPANYFDDSVCIIDEATGRGVCTLIRGVLTPAEYQLAWRNLRCGGKPVHSSSRGRTVGRGDPEHQDQD